MDNSDQKNAIQKAVEWYSKVQNNDAKQIFHLSGKSGTGKTYCAKRIIEELGLNLSTVAFATFSGKASLVLRQRGLPARTIHKLIYDYEVKKGKPCFKKKPFLDFQYPLIVIDESSMVGKRIWEDLLSFGLPILLLGDENQLPPVEDTPLSNCKPDVTLNMIMRQALDNPIIQIAEEILKGNLYLDYGVLDKKVWIGDREKITERAYKNSDIIICAKNSTRDGLNTWYREHFLGTTSLEPIEGDKLICRKNNWDSLIGSGEYPLINGMIGYCDNILITDSFNPNLYFNFWPDFLEHDELGFNKFDHLTVDARAFRTSDYSERKAYIADFHSKSNKFEFGYAITGHLSQGSEWDKVICLFERMGDNDFMRKWFYTVVTRSSNKLYIGY